MFKKKLICAAASVAVLLTSSSVFANKVDLDESEGTFYCEVKTINPMREVDIHTSGVKVKGFCKGEDYVTQEGHIQGRPMRILKKVYFEYKQDGITGGYVDVVATNADDIDCQMGKGEGRKSYSNSKYC
jgi:hypothetical protein